MKRHRWVVLGLAATALTLFVPQAQAKKSSGPAGTYDEGRLVASWFSQEPLTFVEADEIDYLWVREGFDVAGKSFQFKSWPAPVYLGEDAEDRDQDDKDLAKQLNSNIVELLVREWGEAWAGKGAKTSTSSGDIVVEGRIVDCSTGSAAAKFWVGMGAGAGSTVVDLKFTEKGSGRLVAAMHHRIVSGTNWSTTDSKFKKWIRKVGDEIADEGLGKLYEKGDRVKK
ncbi:MAG: DUF4410 domain-containing protein [Acidobacteria bacterium]|nr:DUF4410 domain-containing protein [Acidobacteriota bacterium]